MYLNNHFGLRRCLIPFAFPSEQDEDLDQLEETVISTKHIASAVNEELDLHTRLLVGSNIDDRLLILRIHVHVVHAASFPNQLNFSILRYSQYTG